MKKRDIDIRPYTKQFYKGNRVCFVFALCETLLTAIGALICSWLIQQLVDLIGGYETSFTLLSLLMGAWRNYSGEILFDETEIREIGSESLFETESIIQQNVFIFNATIKDNITMFRDFPEAEIERAIQLSGLSALIAERGEDYLCGEGGCGLSGGEKQRISIARSLLKKSQVLLVDEATASLDAETAYQVSDALLSLSQVTAIMVTHSLDESILRRCDRIITLKNGSVIEEGTFDELISEKGYFYSLYTVSH